MTAQIPDENGDFGDKPSSQTVVVLLLGSRTNKYVYSLLRSILTEPNAVACIDACLHTSVLTCSAPSPLGIFYPAFKEMNNLLVDMLHDLESNREDYGCEF